MGSTFVDYRGRGFEAHDSALEVWLMLLVRQIDEVEDPPAWLHELRDEWELQSTAGFGFGVMPGLNRFLTTNERRDVVVAICQQALADLMAHGEVLPRAYLNSLGTGAEGDAFTRDARTEELLRPARYFIKLLDGTLSESETDARFPPA